MSVVLKSFTLEKAKETRRDASRPQWLVEMLHAKESIHGFKLKNFAADTHLRVLFV